MEEKLIELARAKPALYDANHPDYFRGKMKQDIWKEIAKSLKLSSAGAAKSAWEKLRNNHRDALRRQRAAVENGAPPGTIKKWRYQKQMEFLLNYMNVRPCETDLGDGRDIDKTQEEFEYVNVTLSNLADEDSLEDDVNIINHSDIPELYAQSPPSASDSAPSDLISSNPKLTNKKVKKQDGCAVIKQKTVQGTKRKTIPENDSPTDEMYHFFLSMYKITKKMPPASQHIVRRKVFNAVSHAEAELLGIDEISQNLYQYNSTSFVTDVDQGNGTVKFLPETA